jgi:hypothetical protein
VRPDREWPASDRSNRLGHITREAPSVVRHVVVEAAWQGIRRSARLRAFYERVRRADPARKKIALVATAHYLAPGDAGDAAHGRSLAIR